MKNIIPSTLLGFALLGLTAEVQAADIAGSTLEHVEYWVYRPGQSSLYGEFSVTESGTDVLVNISSVPAGSGYIMILAGSSLDGEQYCEGATEPFSVVSGSPTSVAVTMACRGLPGMGMTFPVAPFSGTGSISLAMHFNGCPEALTAMASPVAAPVGSTVTLSATAEDLEGDSLSFFWYHYGTQLLSVATGSIVCLAPGPYDVFAVVLDSVCATSSDLVTVDCL